ncbi:MAG: transposase [Streptosporangiaceae bacterium]
MAWPGAGVERCAEDSAARGRLAAFRSELHGCFTARADALFELADAVLCAEGPVKTLVGLSLAPEHRRGHGALYDAVNHGRIEIGRLRRAVAGLPLPRAAGGRLMLAVDVSNWLRPDAVTSPERLFCHCYARGKGNAQMIPGWPYSLVAALEPGRTSWVRPLDAVRLGPADDATEVTAGQVREVVTRIIAAGHWKDGGPDILVIFDAGYDLTSLGPAAPGADQPRRMGDPRRPPAGHRRHPHPAARRRSSAWLPAPGADVAMVIPPGRPPRRGDRAAAGVPAAL